MDAFGVKVATGGRYGSDAKTHQRPTTQRDGPFGRLGQWPLHHRPTSTPVSCDRPDEIGPPMRSKSEGFGVRVDQKNAPVVDALTRMGAAR